MSATVLVTGANGFIGSHTTMLLESLGHRVVAVDVVPRPPDLSLLPIRTPSVLFDVTDPERFRKVCAQEKPSHIFHAAHPPREETPRVLEFVLKAMANVLEAAAELNVKRMVYASSGALYGQLRKRDGSPIREDDPVAIYPTYFYRSAKIVSEWLGDYHAQKRAFSFVALRFSSVYGPGLGRGIPLELKKGVLGHHCKPYLTRLPDDPVYVDDVAEAVRLALFCEKPLRRAYNIGLGQGCSNEDLANSIRRHLPEISFEIGKHPLAATIGPHRDRDVLDIALARRELEWTPKFDLDRGVAAIGEWLKKERHRLKI
ncbi:MAG TPA: NAD-dependent epimerase/dehydratase family protein [Candidatus Acidoferrales bacterium]|nr:NAD-dependent epimerase/dehydratase family protein [Candidatus Acidoferrales bacterium]